MLRREQQYRIVRLESEIQSKNFEIKTWILAGVERHSTAPYPRTTLFFTPHGFLVMILSRKKMLFVKLNDYKVGTVNTCTEFYIINNEVEKKCQTIGL